LPAKKWVIVATIAGPQSRDFKRYIAKNSTRNSNRCFSGGSVRRNEHSGEGPKTPSVAGPQNGIGKKKEGGKHPSGRADFYVLWAEP